MILDKYLELSNEQEVLASEASDSDIDALAAGDAIKSGPRLKVQVQTAFVSGDSATLTIALQCDGDSAFGSVKTLFTSAAFAVDDGDLAIGKVLVDIEIPPALCERYIRLYYTVGVGSFSAGKLDSNIAIDTNKTMDKQL